MPWPVPNRPPCSTASSTPRPPSPAVAAGAGSTSRPTGPGLVTSRRSSSACSRYPSRPETRTTRRTDSTTPARRTAPTEATLGPAGTPRPENPTPRQPTIHTHQRNEDPETPRHRGEVAVNGSGTGRGHRPPAYGPRPSGETASLESGDRGRLRISRRQLLRAVAQAEIACVRNLINGVSVGAAPRLHAEG